MYEVLVCVQLLWHDHSGLGKLAGHHICRPVELRGDESARTEGIWLLESSISAQTVHSNLSIFSSRTCLHV